MPKKTMQWDLKENQPKKSRYTPRNDRHKRIHVPVKDVYLYPLVENFREALRDDLV